MSTVERLIAGLQILQRYAPALSPYSTHRSRRLLEIHEEEFGKITEEDRTTLVQLHWVPLGTYLWVF